MFRYFFFLFCIALYGCALQDETEHSFKAVKDFHIDHKALKDGELVTIIYATSGNPVDGPSDFYFQWVVVSEESGDTVNILTPIQSRVTESDLMRAYRSIQNPTYRMSCDQFRAQGLIKDETEFKEVIRWNRDLHFLDNDYPACIGLLAVITDEGN